MLVYILDSCALYRRF